MTFISLGLHRTGNVDRRLYFYAILCLMFMVVVRAWTLLAGSS